LATVAANKIYLDELEKDRLSVLASPFEDGSGTVWTPIRAIAWSPDGKRLAISAVGRDSPAVFFLQADGSGEPDQITYGPNEQIPAGWSPDGNHIIYLDRDVTTHWDIWKLPLEPRGEPKPVVKARLIQYDAVLSPDGRWLAYASSETGRFEVYVKPYIQEGGAVQISTEGGLGPIWAPDGRKIYYQQDETMVVVEIDTTPSFSAERPRVVFEGSFLPARWTRSYDLSPDG
jgi:Tol biopolymer transport system component